VNAQLLGRKPPPDPSASNGSALRIKRANFNVSIFNAVFLSLRTIARFEAKPHVLYQHDLDAPVPNEGTMTSKAGYWQYGKILIFG
jgi:hypothetical protein